MTPAAAIAEKTIQEPETPKQGMVTVKLITNTIDEAQQIAPILKMSLSSMMPGGRVIVEVGYA